MAARNPGRWPPALLVTTRPSKRMRSPRWGWLLVPPEKPPEPEGPLAKSAREIMEILEAFDLTRCAWSAA